MKNQNCNPTPHSIPAFRAPKSAVGQSKIRDQGSKAKFTGPLFPRTPRGGNKQDYQSQPKV